jgi:hypothetical protein
VSATVTKMIRCLNETCSKFRVAKHLSATLAVKNGLKKANALSHYISVLLCNIRSGKFK